MSFVRRVFFGFTGVCLAFGSLGFFTPNFVLAATPPPVPVDAYEQIVNPVFGQGIIFANMPGDAAACKDFGQCTLDQIMQLFINVITLILGISGSVVLLMFVYGGFVWITSRGEAKHVQEGKDTMVRAMLGFAIIILSYSLINFLIAALAGDKFGRPLNGDEGTVEKALDGVSDNTGP